MVESERAARQTGFWTLTTGQLALVALALVAVVALNIAFLNYLYGGPERHTDGEGPLGSRGGYGMGFGPNAEGSSWTVGLALCIAQGSQPAVLDGTVTPTGVVGSGIRFLGAFMRQGGEALIGGSVAGFPPTGGGALQPVKGFAVTRHCQLGDRDPTQLLFGVGRGPGTGGGGWQGFDIGYTAGWRHHIVSLEGYDIAVCGADSQADVCPEVNPSPTAVSTGDMRLMELQRADRGDAARSEA